MPHRNNPEGQSDANRRPRSRSDFFVAGGTLAPTVPSYVKRPADDELFDLALNGQFCYVLTTRQMGKSSLMIRTARRLQDEGVQTAIIDLTEMGTSEANTWYLDLITELADELDIEEDPETWWEERASLGYVRRFTNFLRNVVLTEIEGRIVIFIDEIDTTLRFPFSDDFFAAIRATYNSRASDPTFNRLSFILIGVASPSDLIKDHARTPFNIGQGIKLGDFSQFDADILQARLETLYQGQGGAIFSHIYYWTGGHPYLTQKICQAIAESDEENWSDKKIDQLVDNLFLTEEARKETNLQFVQDSLDAHPQKRHLLNLYRQVYQGEEIVDDERSPVQNQLKLTGLIRAQNGLLTIRCEIYRRVFNLDWVTANLPIDMDAADFFVVGGTVRSDSPSYVKRQADDELIKYALAGKFCYVLTPRQMGKSSLMVRTARHLEQQGVRTAIIDLTRIGQVTVDQWYLNLLAELKESFKLNIEAEKWWQTHNALGPTRSFTNFLREVVLTEIQEQVVIFIDEIDTTLSLPFSDDFFAAIRAMHNARANDSEFNRLTFVLFGVATPSDLIKDRTRAPFNIGQGIDLDDFSRENTRALEQGLKDIYPEQGEAIFERIYYWTNGHPYLTQKLCLTVAENGLGRPVTANEVDEFVHKLFLSDEARKESNLQFIQDSIQTSPQQRELVTLYRKVFNGENVAENERSVIQNQLKLFGLVRIENGILKIRNQIYRHVFDLDWITANTPINWPRRIAIIASSLIVVLVAMVGIALYWQVQQNRAQNYIDTFRTTTEPNIRVTSLAGLFDLPGFGEQAQTLFYKELTPEDRLALLASADPHTVGPQLITVVQGLYTDLENNERDNAMLQAMLEPLRKVDDPRSVNLQVGIEQWLEGRRLYGQGQYRQAVSAYDVAIRLNDRNPGIYFDRGLAYLGLENLEQALADFETVLDLDPNRRLRVEQVVINNPTLYDTVIAQGTAHPAVVAIVPSPTSTPTATPTPTSTSIPTATTIPTATPLPTTTPTVAEPASSAPAQAPQTAPDTPTPTATQPPPTPTSTPRPATMAYVIGLGENHNLGLVSSAGNILNPALHPLAAAPTWSPDGTKIAFYAEPGVSALGGIYAQGNGIWILNVEPYNLELFYSIDHVRNMDWAPVGDKLAVEFGPPGVTHQISILDTRNKTEISRFPGEQPVWSPDGQELVIKSCAPECGLWKVGFDGGGGELITTDSTDSYPTWSSTGEYIVFTSRARTGDWEIYRLRLADNDLVRLTSRPGTDTTPVFSPDGLEIYFRTDAFGKGWRIAALSVDGRKERPIINDIGPSNDWGLARPDIY